MCHSHCTITDCTPVLGWGRGVWTTPSTRQGGPDRPQEGPRLSRQKGQVFPSSAVCRRFLPKTCPKQLFRSFWGIFFSTTLRILCWAENGPFWLRQIIGWASPSPDRSTPLSWNPVPSTLHHRGPSIWGRVFLSIHPLFFADPSLPVCPAQPQQQFRCSEG